MARLRLDNGISPRAGRAMEIVAAGEAKVAAKLAAADAKVREAKAGQREAESRADAADRRAERLEAALERIGERLDAIERRLEQRPAEARPIRQVAEKRMEATSAKDHFHGWQAIGDHLGLDVNAVRHLHRTQKLPAYKLGRTMASSVVALDRWRQQRLARAEADGGLD